jgi:hypothetical protein
LGVIGIVAGFEDQRISWGSIIMGFVMGCCCVDHSICGWGINVGVAVGQRSWTVDAWGLVKMSGYQCALWADVLVEGKDSEWHHQFGCWLVL